MRVAEILNGKGDLVYQISPNATLTEVVDELVNRNCGSLVVREGESVVGIITERDILRSIASHKRPLSELFVRDFMTKDFVAGHPSDDISSVMGLMTSRHIRHLPIMDDYRLVGLISIGDIVKAQHAILVQENHYMKVYIQS